MSKFRFIAAGGLLLGIASAAFSADSLAVGNAAPPLKVAKWVKGTPVKGFEKGKVYVVEFWATWCGPCKQSIPHLTEMAKQFKGKATFTGVSVWEEQNPKSDAYMAKVADFVKDMGDKMDYNVAVDDMQGTMAKTWMAAANQNGIPTAFVIGKDGKVAWIGHPMAGLDKVVEAVINDTFDAKAEAERMAKEQAAMEELQKAFQGVQEKAGKGDFKGAVEDLDKLIASKPDMKGQLAPTRFMLLLQFDEPTAYAYGKEVATGDLKDDSVALNSIAWAIVDDNAKLKSPDYGAAVAIAEAAAAASKNSDGMILDTLGYALFKNGQIDKAIEVQTKAVELAKANKSTPAETIKEISDRLEQFKKKKGGN